MSLMTNALYLDDLDALCALPLPWEKLAGKTLTVSGASGMIGRFLIDALLRKNDRDDLGLCIHAMGRSKEKLESRFRESLSRKDLQLIACDPLALPPDEAGPADFILHLASATHPLAYAADPIGVIAANVTATERLLQWTKAQAAARFLFASSVEIYGENRSGGAFAESDFGYLDCNTLRAAYPESKRCGEALCQAYRHQAGVDAVILRLPRLFGPTMLEEDSKALSQFIKNCLDGKAVTLKSDGSQRYSFAYVADAAAGMLACLLLGQSGEAYNLADVRCDASLLELAELLANRAHTRISRESPDENERAGYSAATLAVMDGGKLRSLGFESRYDLKSGLGRTLAILRAEGFAG